MSGTKAPAPFRDPELSGFSGTLGEFGNDQLAFMRRLASYGEPLVETRFGTISVVQFNDLELCRDVLQDRTGRIVKPTAMNWIFKAASGTNLFSSEGDDWQRRRSALNPGFGAGRLDGMVATMAAAIDAELASWPVGEPIDLERRLVGLTTRVVMNALFGIDTAEEGSSVDPAATAAAFARLVEWIEYRFYNLWAPPKIVPTRRNLQLRRDQNLIRRHLQAQLDARRSGAERDDLLGLLLECTDEEGRPLDDQTILEECLGFFGAGHDTLSALLSWAVVEVARRPDLAEVIATEAAALPDEPAIGDVADLVVTDRVLNECLRLHPPGWGIARMAKRRTVIGGCRIRPFSTLLVPTALLHRSEDHWSEPKRFDPDRWRPERLAAEPANAFMPFGLGPRRCIGNRFAMTEAKLVLAKLCRSRSFEVTRADSTPEVRLTLRVAGGVPAVLTPR